MSVRKVEVFISFGAQTMDQSPYTNSLTAQVSQSVQFPHIVDFFPKLWIKSPHNAVIMQCARFKIKCFNGSWLLGR